MATQVDGARRDVDVHEVVNDSALDVVLHVVHQVSAAHVEDLDVGQVSVFRGSRENKSGHIYVVSKNEIKQLGSSKKNVSKGTTKLKGQTHVKHLVDRKHLCSQHCPCSVCIVCGIRVLVQMLCSLWA